MQSFDPSEHSHRRWNPLKQEWVLCSPHRTKRPWQGQTEEPDHSKLPQYDPKCYLCPGNKRAGEETNPKYESTFRFEVRLLSTFSSNCGDRFKGISCDAKNDYAAVRQEEVDFPADLSPEGAQVNDSIASLYKAEPARGKCYVICFSPRHDLTMAQLNQDEMLSVISAWQDLYTDISTSLPWIKYIQIFENKGSMMGCSNPHPHGQAWSLSYIPTEALKVLSSQASYTASSTDSSSNLLLDYAQTEITSKSSRIVLNSEHFVALVPYWALWPFEVIICPNKRRIANVVELRSEEKQDLASVLRKMTCRYDNLFQCSFPYSMGIYQSPTLNDTTYASSAQLHFSFSPPLLRSASVRKHIVGFEIYGETQRDLTAEQAAGRLKECAEVHYKTRD